MRLQKGKLTRQQAVFATEYANTGSRDYAARKAGYHAPAQGASQNLQNPEVIEAIRRHSIARLANELLPLSLDNLAATLRDSDAPYTAKMKAASIVIDNTIGRKAQTVDKDPEQMSLSDLQAERRRLEEMLEEARRPVLELEAQPTEDDLFG